MNNAFFMLAVTGIILTIAGIASHIVIIIILILLLVIPKDFRPMHGLRHTFASKLISSGKIGLATLQKLLTHENPSMTNRYAHLEDEAMKRAASITDEIFVKDRNI